MIRGCFSVMAAFALAALAACEDEALEPEAEAETSRAVRRRDDRVAQCLDQVEAGERCGECACENCIDALEVCEPDASCRAIRACAHAARCTGAACLGPCGDVIREHGGPFGRPARLAHAIGLCVDRRCAEPC